ncbi:MAG: dihydroneopterin aldolase [Flavobacteriales bacterium]|nr:dihydroneopterin aldolase [Flavobacteriales bacterium]MBL6873442.1 dihydroneopterin aldolase [Flavobacteriales bacterium]
MGVISVKGIKAYAYHGCLDEERKIGSDYEVNVTVETDLQTSSISDKLADTVDYVSINSIVKTEMSIPSNLLEHVVKRIIDAIVLNHTMIETVEVSVSKINPPINGDVESVLVKEKFFNV